MENTNAISLSGAAFTQNSVDSLCSAAFMERSPLVTRPHTHVHLCGSISLLATRCPIHVQWQGKQPRHLQRDA